MFVDVWTLHCSDEIDAQIEAHEGSFRGQNSHPAIRIFGANSMVGYIIALWQEGQLCQESQ